MSDTDPEIDSELDSEPELGPEPEPGSRPETKRTETNGTETNGSETNGTGTNAGSRAETNTGTETESEPEPAEEPRDASDSDGGEQHLDEKGDGTPEAAGERSERRPTPIGESTLITKTVVRVVTPLVLLTAVALLLQGHNLPGGGFVAGVLTAAAVSLLYIVYGSEYIETELTGTLPATDDFSTGPAIVTEYRRLFAGGLALAAGAGIVSMVFGLPFLSQTVVFLHHLPVYGELELASAFVFDVGVFVVVVGALLTIVAVVGSE